MSCLNRRNRCCLIGSWGCGKTALRFRFLGQPFIANTNRVTIAVQTSVIYVPTEENPDNQNIKLMIDDTSGEERFRNAITRTFVRHAQAVLLCFDLSDQKSFTEAQEVWMPWCKEFGCSESTIILVGMKSDLPPALPPRVVKKWTREANLEYFEVSSKTQEGIDALARRLGSHFRCQHDFCFSIMEGTMNISLEEEDRKGLLSRLKAKRKSKCPC